MKYGHRHKWKTNVVMIDNNNCVAGMRCKCGKLLSQGEVEGMLNGKGSGLFTYVAAGVITIIGAILMAHI